MNRYYGIHRFSRWFLVGLADLWASCYVKKTAPEFNKKDIRRVLILRPDHLGDVVLTTPVVSALRSALPDAYIAMAVKQWSIPAVEANPKINRVTVFNAPWCCNPGQTPFTGSQMSEFVNEQKSEQFDLIIASQVDYRTNRIAYEIGAKHRVGYAFRGGGPFLTRVVEPPETPVHTVRLNLGLVKILGFDVKGIRPEFYLAQAYRAFAEKWFDENKLNEARPVIAFHVGAGSDFKRLSDKKVVEIIEQVDAEYGVAVVLMAGPGEKDLAGKIAAQTKGPRIVVSAGTSLQEMAAIINYSDVFVGFDSGPAHIAGALRKPSVVIFGPSDYRMWGPLGNESRVVCPEIDCRPCPMPQACGRDLECMDMISVEAVVAKVGEVLEAL